MYVNMRQTIQPISTTPPHTMDKQKKHDILGLKHGSAYWDRDKNVAGVDLLMRYQPSPSSITSIEIQSIFIYIQYIVFQLTAAI